MLKKGECKILVVDDAAFMRNIIKDILLKSGFSQIYEAKDGKDAIKYFTKYKPDIVTLDIIMPGVGGLEALKTILGIEPATKIIMITSVGQEQMVQDAIKYGAKAYVEKPFDDTKLVQIIEKCLA